MRGTEEALFDDPPARRGRRKKRRPVNFALVFGILLGVGGLMLAAVVGGVVLLVYPGSSSAPAPSAASGRLRDRLVGTWDADLGERGSATLQFNRDGTLVLTMNAVVNGQRRNVREPGHWEVVREDGERLTVTRRTDNLGTASTNEFAFAGNDTFTIAGEGGGLTYHRH